MPSPSDPADQLIAMPELLTSELKSKEASVLPAIMVTETGVLRNPRLGPGQDQPFYPSSTSARLPIVIPADKKRASNVAPVVAPPEKRQRRHIGWPIVPIACALVIVLAFIFVVPLGSSQQKPVTLASAIGHLFDTAPQGNINTAQNGGQPTRMIDSTCGGTDIWGTCAKALLNNGSLGSGQFLAPIKGDVISQLFGVAEYQVWCGCVKPHSGIDLAAPYGTPVTAADGGEVIWVGWDWSGLGWAVKISHGNYIATIYGHLDHYIVKVGQYVAKGEIIAYEGSTGASTGPHVHFMVLVHNSWVDPQGYMQLP